MIPRQATAPLGYHDFDGPSNLWPSYHIFVCEYEMLPRIFPVFIQATRELPLDIVKLIWSFSIPTGGQSLALKL